MVIRGLVQSTRARCSKSCGLLGVSGRLALCLSRFDRITLRFALDLMLLNLRQSSAGRCRLIMKTYQILQSLRLIVIKVMADQLYTTKSIVKRKVRHTLALRACPLGNVGSFRVSKQSRTDGE